MTPVLMLALGQSLALLAGALLVTAIAISTTRTRLARRFASLSLSMAACAVLAVMGSAVWPVLVGVR